jgi:hypothetical protein
MTSYVLLWTVLAIVSLLIAAEARRDRHARRAWALVFCACSVVAIALWLIK